MVMNGLIPGTLYGMGYLPREKKQEIQWYIKYDEYATEMLTPATRRIAA
jgi:hypothetical protein